MEKAVKKQGLLNREAAVRRSIPDFLDYKTALYVGIRPGRMQICDLFMEKGYEIDVVEIWPKNFLYLESLQAEKHPFRNLFCSDIKLFAAAGYSWDYDVVVWWHGPEHMPKADLPTVLDGLFKMTKQALILACPWGEVAQGAAGGNPNEVHISYLTPGYFEALGFKTSTLGSQNRGGSNILSWKRKEPQP